MRLGLPAASTVFDKVLGAQVKSVQLCSVTGEPTGALRNPLATADLLATSSLEADAVYCQISRPLPPVMAHQFASWMNGRQTPAGQGHGLSRAYTIRSGSRA